MTDDAIDLLTFGEEFEFWLVWFIDFIDVAIPWLAGVETLRSLLYYVLDFADVGIYFEKLFDEGEF